MKTLCLVPYCPWPATTGTKVEMMKHLLVLRDLGQCTIVSARSKPVGFGWSDRAKADLEEMGFSIILREDVCRLSFRNMLGIGYASVCTVLRMEKAFGHSNPYHRWAFSESWLRELSRNFDLCVMQYGFWAGFCLACPKSIVVHELLSNFHWEGDRQELRDFSTAGLVLVVGKDEECELREKGLESVLWSPPAVEPSEMPVSDEVGLIGTRAPQNLEGLRWLAAAKDQQGVRIKVFGNLAEEATGPLFVRVGRYESQNEPYLACGILLLTRPDRPGLQIKAVEALAHGRAIVARRGSMRGLPEEDGAWITVDTPEEMIAAAGRLQAQKKEREQLALRARSYYKKYLDHTRIISTLRAHYLSLINK